MTCISEISTCVNNAVVEGGTPLARSIANAAIWAVAGGFAAWNPWFGVPAGGAASWSSERMTPRLFPDAEDIGITNQVNLNSDSSYDTLFNIWVSTEAYDAGFYRDVDRFFNLVNGNWSDDGTFDIWNLPSNPLTLDERTVLSQLVTETRSFEEAGIEPNLLPTILLEDFRGRYAELYPEFMSLFLESLDEVEGAQEAQILNSLFFADPAVLEAIAPLVASLEATGDIGGFIALTQDPTLMNLLTASTLGDGIFFDSVSQDMALLDEFSGSPILSIFASNFLSAPNTQGLLAEQLFTTTGGEDGGNILFDQAVEAAVNRALGIEEGGYLFDVPNIERPSWMNPAVWEMEMADAEAANPLEQMRNEIASIKTDVETAKGTIFTKVNSLTGSIVDNSNRIGMLHDAVNSLKSQIASLPSSTSCACKDDFYRDLSSGEVPPQLPQPGKNG
jgi:hypothetical protein